MNSQVKKDFFLEEQINDNSVYLIHRAYLTHRINNTQNTHCTKTRSEVKGGGRKPWKQKGSGRARAGSSRSPLWKGGGVTFGPKPKKPYNKINKKEKKKALLTLLQAKLSNLIIYDISNFDTDFKTKNLIYKFEKIGINPKSKIAIILPTNNKNLYLASQNLKNVHIMNMKTLNIKDLLETKHIITNMETLSLIKQYYLL